MKAKIHFGLIALALLGLSGCAKETTLDQVNPDTPIAFDTYLGRAAQTKGDVADLTDLQANGFGVYAFYTATENYSAFQDNSKVPDYMVNEQLTYSGGKWTYSPIKYWPNNTDDMVSFFAYAPYFATGSSATENITSVSANLATGDPTLTFAVAEDVTNQEDLLYATLADQKKPNTSAKATFNFQHALSRVAFKAQAYVDAVNTEPDGTTPDDDMASDAGLATGTTVTINSITLTGKFYTGGTLNLTDGVWTPATPSGSTSYTLSGSQLAVTKVTNAVSAQVNTDTAYMMLIPGTFEGVTITVNYTVETQDDALATGSSKITNVVESDPFNVTFKQGDAYAFVLHLGLNSVKVDAQVTDWSTEGTVVANVPLN